MNTFLPYPHFARSARCLDRQRLGKQRLEVIQILRTLLGHSVGWRHHPAVRMWAGHERALVRYGVAVCQEWRARGYRDAQLVTLWRLEQAYLRRSFTVFPPWLGNPTFHASHRSNLLNKNPVWYGRFGWTEPSNLPYVWPVSPSVPPEKGR